MGRENGRRSLKDTKLQISIINKIGDQRYNRRTKLVKLVKLYSGFLLNR